MPFENRIFNVFNNYIIIGRILSTSCNIPESFGMAVIIAHGDEKIDQPNGDVLSNFETPPRGFIPRGATMMGHNLPRDKQSTMPFQRPMCTCALLVV
jgi:hypothetical protein